MKVKILSILAIVLIAGGIFVNLSAQPQQTIRILYFNDAHELQPVETPVGFIGGVTRMKTLIDSIRKETPDALVLFGGDLAGGTLGGKLFRGSVMVEALNAFPVDYANFGQHEFDYGIANAEKLLQASHFKWFTSNTVLANDNCIPLSYPYIIHKIGQRIIGIIGLTDKINTSKPTSGVKQTDITEAAKTAICQMGKVDYLIAVTQMDMNLNEALLAACPEINLVLTEETSQHKTEVQFVNNCPIIAGCGNMGQLADIRLGDSKTPDISVHVVNSELREDKLLHKFVCSKTEMALMQLNKPLANTSSEFKNQMPPDTSYATGCLIADAFRQYYNTQASIINGGGIRALIPEGSVSVKDVYAVLPFENIIIPVRLSGGEVKEIIRLAAERMLPQVSGLTYEIKQGKNPELKNVYINGKLLANTDTVTVSMPDYIVLGGGNFTKIPPQRWLKSLDECSTDADIVIDYLKARPLVTVSDCNRIVRIIE